MRGGPGRARPSLRISRVNRHYRNVAGLLRLWAEVHRLASGRGLEHQQSLPLRKAVPLQRSSSKLRCGRREGKIWWYEFQFQGGRIRESTGDPEQFVE